MPKQRGDFGRLIVAIGSFVLPVQLLPRSSRSAENHGVPEGPLGCGHHSTGRTSHGTGSYDGEARSAGERDLRPLHVAAYEPHTRCWIPTTPISSRYLRYARDVAATRKLPLRVPAQADAMPVFAQLATPGAPPDIMGTFIGPMYVGSVNTQGVFSFQGTASATQAASGSYLSHT